MGDHCPVGISDCRLAGEDGASSSWSPWWRPASATVPSPSVCSSRRALSRSTPSMRSTSSASARVPRSRRGAHGRGSRPAAGQCGTGRGNSSAILPVAVGRDRALPNGPPRGRSLVDPEAGIVIDPRGRTGSTVDRCGPTSNWWRTDVGTKGRLALPRATTTIQDRPRLVDSEAARLEVARWLAPGEADFGVRAIGCTLLPVFLALALGSVSLEAD
jgi:hypothetical protein